MVFILYFNFKTFKDPNSWSCIRFQCVLHDSVERLSDFWNFYKLKRGDLIDWVEPILQNGWNLSSPFLYSKFKSFIDQESLSFLRFQYILHDSGIPSGEKNCLNYFPSVPPSLPPTPLVYLNFKSFKDLSSWSSIRLQCILVDLGVLFFRFWKFLQVKDRTPNFWSGGTNSPYSLNYFLPHLLYLDFKNFKDAYSLTFIRF